MVLVNFVSKMNNQIVYLGQCSFGQNRASKIRQDVNHFTNQPIPTYSAPRRWFFQFMFQFVLSFLKALCKRINTVSYGIFRLFINGDLNEIIFFTDYLFERLNGSRFSHNNTQKTGHSVDHSTNQPVHTYREQYCVQNHLYTRMVLLQGGPLVSS